MSGINPNDLRRYRMRSTGIVYRVIGERPDEMDFAPVSGGVAMEIKRADVEVAFARCDVIDPKSTTCKGCGGEKLTLYGGVTVCVYCASRAHESIGTPSSDDAAGRFVRHLENASKTVREPAWKRSVAARVLGVYSATSASDEAPRFLIAHEDGYAEAERYINSLKVNAACSTAANLLARSLVGFGCEFEIIGEGGHGEGISLAIFGIARSAWFDVTRGGDVLLSLSEQTKNAPQTYKVDVTDLAREIERARRWIERRHRLLERASLEAWTIKDRSLREQSESVIEKLQCALPYDTGAAPPFCLRSSDDGSFSIEWWLPSCRVAFIIERDRSGSGWYVVALDPANVLDCGPLDTADVPSLVARGLASIGVS